MTTFASVLTDLPDRPVGPLNPSGHDALLDNAAHPFRLMVNDRSAPFQSSPMLPLAAILALISQPALIVDSTAHVRASNPSVPRWLENQKALDVSQGRVSWRNARLQLAFSAALKELTEGPDDVMGHQRKRLQMPSPERALPLIIDCHRLRTAEKAPVNHALLVMHDLQDAPPINLRLLVESFGLTRAEARVAGLLAEGESPADIGLILDLAMGTIRTHLRMIASKLGATRQSEVVRLLTRLPQG
jgi:DNA-binding CsgD family transcriptional regulator